MGIAAQPTTESLEQRVVRLPLQAIQSLPQYARAAIWPMIESGQSPDNIFFGSQDNIALYPLEHRVYAKSGTGRTEISLTPTEFDLLQRLMINPGKVFSHEELYMRTHPDGNMLDSDANLVRWHIKQLRRKIGDDPFNPEYIHTVKGKGYRFGAPVAQLAK